MPLSWHEIKSRAIAFLPEWRGTSSEEAEAKPFLIEFLNIFGISRKRVATFEHRVKKLSDKDGYIDLLWKGTLLVEMKSRGEDLNKAYTQAKDYCAGLKEHELPSMILISDFENFHVYKEDGTIIRFKYDDLINNLTVFESLAGYQKRTYHEQDPVNIKAAELMGKLHDELKEIGYNDHPLEVYLVRLLFILFADDSTIFQKGIFFDYLEQRTNEDGSDLAMHLDQLFQVLDTPEDKRLKTLDEQLNQFPYVNGRLFAERLPTAAFTSQMRQILLDCCKLDWGKISPAIFGSLFQSVMDNTARRNLGAHYTSEKNILKLIKPLFLDELWEEFHAAGENHNKLKQLHNKISKLRFLDPACGCGNFLITAYRELRLLELAIVEKLLKGQMVTNINQYFLVDLDQFYGIELGEFPSQIAQVAMFLIDHQCNMMVSDRFGEYIPLIPLQKSAVIVNENALRLDWQSIIKPLEGELKEPRYHYILGNPPFVGHQLRNKDQMADMQAVFPDSDKSGRLDYVACWFQKAAEYMSNSNTHYSWPTRTAFVSTNSICQGEQAEILWSELLVKKKMQIIFAHRSFRWSNEAKGNAVVTVIIVGFSTNAPEGKIIYDYPDPQKSIEPEVYKAKSINAYLIDGNPTLFVTSRSKSIHTYPAITKGSQATDGGGLFLNKDERDALIQKEPMTSKYIKLFIGAEEFLHAVPRYCLWLKDVSPVDLINMPTIKERLAQIKTMRAKSPTKSVRDFASLPMLFTQDRQPATSYLVIPRHSSENREYIPIGYVSKDIICGDANLLIPEPSLYVFGMLQSKMHNVWTRTVCGKLESRIRYSSAVYNNYPWPEAPTEKQKHAVEEAAQAVLYARAQFPDSSLADLYDPNTMPPTLVKAHQQLDKAVDLCYRPQPFTSEAKRIEYLFELYEKYTGGLFQPEKKGKKKQTKLTQE